MELRTMYPPQKDSPSTFLVGAINATDTFAIVGNSSLLPQTLPYPLTIGIDRTLTETVLVTAVDNNINKITFTRGANAYPWSAGTNVGRVFNAKDLKDVQDNVTDLYIEAANLKQNVTGLEGTVGTLQTTVGNASSGLVKGLADEITRAKAAEGAEVTRATAAETNIDNKKVDKTALPQVITDWVYSADGTKVLVTITRYNAVNKETTQYTKTIPVVTDATMGLMTPEAYNELTALRNDVMALQQQGGKFIGLSFNSKAALDAYPIPGSVKMGDFTYVLDDETHQDATTRYVYNGVKFVFAFVVEHDPVGIANTTTPGLVKSSNTAGKTFVEVDGTMSVMGWDSLNTTVAAKVPSTRKINLKPLDADITLNASDVGATTSSVAATLSTTWAGTGPYTQAIAIAGMTSSKNATIGLAANATQAQREAARNAMLNVTAQTTNQITITADGDKPTITIPISVILMP